MESFAKAHVVKDTNSFQKDHKSEDKVKKQLKQMLYGYRQSNSDLINNLAPEEIYDDDSSSVSGFSDLNLTDSSFDGRNDTQETVSPKMNISGFNKSNIDLPLPDTDENKESDESDSVSVTAESISEYEDTNMSLSADILLDSQLEESDADVDLSLNSSNESVEDETEDFDCDGTLADKIKEKMKGIVKDSDQSEKTKNKKKNKEKKSKKRKLSHDNNDDSENITEYRGPYNPNHSKNASMEVDDVDSGDNTKILFINEYRGPLRPKNLDSDFSSDEELSYESKEESQEISKDEHSHNESPDFISVTANDMPSQSIDEILGEYKYPTIKNLPCESQTVMQSTSRSGIFITKDLSFSKVVTEEDTDSLVPEVADDIAVEDIDLEVPSSKVLLEAITNEPADDTDLDTEALNDSELYISTQLVGNDTTVCNDTESIGQDSDKDMSTGSVESTLINPVKIYYGKNCCIIILKHPTDIYIHGKVKVKRLGGTIEVLGYTLQDEFYEIYAPQYNYAQYLRTVENDNNSYYGLFSKLTSSGLLISEAEEIVTSTGDYDGIIYLQPLKKRKLDFVEKYFTAGNLFSKINRSGPCFQKASEKLSCTLYSSMPWRSFSLHPSWKQVLQAGIGKQSRGIICGGKGVGKSTFLRYYINKRLAKSPILLIDLDPGQCELTVAGNISATVISEPLLGPNFTHLKTPDIMLNIGMINTMDDPRRYVKAIEMIIAQCNNDESLSKMPWIVNTMGMCNDMGLAFITLIIIHVKPTFVLQIDSKNPKQRFECFLKSETVTELYEKKYPNHQLFLDVETPVILDYCFIFSDSNESLVKNNFSLAPRDERYLNFLAYFGELIDVNNDSLLGVVPYEVKLKELHIGTNVKINEEDIGKVINGKVVALCQQRHYKGVFTLGDEPIKCFGHGLIRGIDWPNKVAYILSPVPGEVIAEVNTLVYADWAPEIRGQEASVPADTPVPYRTMSRYDHRQLTFPPKRRFNPLQLLKMRAA